MNQVPPPVIDSARLIAFAYNDADVAFTDRITLYVGNKDSMERLNEVPCLAICSNYAVRHDILLLLCNAKWESQGVIACTTVEEAKLEAERGYSGITAKWKDSPYSDQEVDDYLREIYEVDPSTEWWKVTCSFCGKDNFEVEHQILASEKAVICRQCVEDFYEYFQSKEDGQ